MADENDRQKLHESYRREYETVAASWRFLISLRFILAGFSTTLQSGLLTVFHNVYKDKTLTGNKGGSMSQKKAKIETHDIKDIKDMSEERKRELGLWKSPNPLDHRWFDAMMLVGFILGLAAFFIIVCALFFKFLPLSL